MDEEYQVGDFGKARFPRKRKHGIKAYGRITGMDSKYIEFTDNDGFEYIVNKNKLKFSKVNFNDPIPD